MDSRTHEASPHFISFGTHFALRIRATRHQMQRLSQPTGSGLTALASISIVIQIKVERVEL